MLADFPFRIRLHFPGCKVSLSHGLKGGDTNRFLIALGRPLGVFTPITAARAQIATGAMSSQPQEWQIAAIDRPTGFILRA
jgi:hypothetical protein